MICHNGAKRITGRKRGTGKSGRTLVAFVLTLCMIMTGLLAGSSVGAGDEYVARVREGSGSWEYFDTVTKAFNHANSTFGTFDDVQIEVLKSGTYVLESAVTIKSFRSLSLTRSSGVGKVTLVKSRPADPMITINNITTVTISGIDFDGASIASTKTGGGVLFIKSDNLTIENCSFTDCVADNKAGGAVLHNRMTDTSPTAVLKNCSFNSCSALKGNGSGGAFETTAKQLTITECDFNNCVAGKGGGAVNLYTISANNTSAGTSLTVADSSFSECNSGNSSTRGGGAISSTARENTFNNSTFTKCKANTTGSSVSDGGAINLIPDSSIFVETKVSGCSFSECSASGNGGAVSANSGDTTLTGCTFTGCTAVGNGGAVNSNMSTAGAAVTMSDCSFSDCSSSKDGGAVYSTSSDMTLTECTFTGCTCNGSGGGLCSKKGTDGAKLLVDRCNFKDCVNGVTQDSDNIDGGGIYSAAFDNTVKDCNFTGCIAKTKVVVPSNNERGGNGGAVAFYNSSATSTAVIEGGEFTGCRAQGKGSAIHSDKGILTLRDGATELNIHGNTAKVSTVFSVTLNITGGSITNNVNSGTDADDSAAVKATGTIHLSGDPVIRNNKHTDGGCDRDVYLLKGNPIRISVSDLDPAADIGIYRQDQSSNILASKDVEYNTNLHTLFDDRTGTRGMEDPDNAEHVIFGAVTAKAAAGQYFSDFTDEADVKISRESSFTVRFGVTGSEPVLRFSSGVPAGTTVILRVDGGDYYCYTFDAEASAVPVTEFVKMGAGTAFSAPPTNYTAQFIVDFSRSSGLSGTGPLQAGLSYGTSENYSVSVAVTPVDAPSFGLTVEGEAASVAYTASAARAAKWEDRGMALAITAQDGVTVPPDAVLKVAIGGTAENHPFSNGAAVVPLGQIANYSVTSFSLDTAFPVSGSYGFDVKLIVSATPNGVSPFVGDVVGTGKLTLAVDGEETPSAKITTDDRAVTAGTEMTFTVETLDADGCDVTVTVLKKGADWDNTAVSMAETVLVGSSTFTFTPEDAGSYKAVVTVSKAGVAILTVPYYFLAIGEN